MEISWVFMDPIWVFMDPIWKSTGFSDVYKSMFLGFPMYINPCRLAKAAAVYFELCGQVTQVRADLCYVSLA